MLTKQERNDVQDIMQRVNNHQHVSVKERRWIISLMAREGHQASPRAHAECEEAGFDMTGVGVATVH